MQSVLSPHAVAPAITCAALAISASLSSSSAAQAIQFTDTGQQIPGEGAISLALGDIDNDGDIDAVTPVYVGPILVLLNGGDGTFTEGETIQEGSLSGNLALVDLDGDDDLDIFIVNHSFSTTVYFNDGDGTFTSSGQFLNSANSHGLGIGDIDEDGDIDAFITDIAGNYNAPVMNDGAGVFAYGESNSLPIARDVELGDLNGDGHLDVFLAQGSHGSNDPTPWPDRVFFGDGAGGFVDSGQRLDTQASLDVRLADFDADDDLDAVVGNSDAFGSNPANRVYFNDGAGNFTNSGQSLSSAESSVVDIGDLDLDDDIDIVFSHGQEPEEVFLNDGNGQFSLAGTLSVDGGKVALGDLDRDGDLDIYMLASGGSRVLLNGTIAEADLLDFTVAFGRYVSGGLDSLLQSDNVRLRVRSRPRFTGVDSHVVDLVVGADGADLNAGSIGLSVEARSSSPGTALRLRLRNWPQARWDLLHQMAIGPAEVEGGFAGADAGRYVRSSDGRVQASLRSSVVASFSISGFVAGHDRIRFLLRH